MKADVLSDVLRAVRLTGAVYFDFELSSPWVAEAPPSREIAAKVMPGAQRVIEYHLIARGHVLGARGRPGADPAAGGRPDRVPAGRCARPVERARDAGGARHVGISPARRRRCRSFYELGGGGPERARVVCCFLGCDERPYNPLLTALPAVIHLAAAGPHATTGWLGTLLNIAVKESGSARAGQRERPGAAVGADVRRDDPPVPRDAAARPDRLARGTARSGCRTGAGGAARRAAAKPWTVERLARLVGLSRSVLAERFTGMVGQPPMQYLALWRMQLASRLLLEGGQVAAVAGAVGYESEAAFSRAFKKLVGQAPATWRRGTRA